ncbi:OadG family protein [Fusobacterium sp.]|uniref:OadG family protein n=1 Tax=Fusobacterium sp. TaxID=68766 RepID=UPI00290130C3|nr:OadG family protein [Fusobacterium sp.]MDU1910347.1 OadG family protein [Fusobacterium sp.]
MITTEYISFLESLFSSLLGMSIVFIALVFLAIFVMIVSKVIAILEKNLIKTAAPTANTAAVSSSVVGTSPKKDNKEGVKIAVVTAAISEEMNQPVDKFIITNIKKI